jgi:hypothetical protein
LLQFPINSPNHAELIIINNFLHAPTLFIKTRYHGPQQKN